MLKKSHHPTEQQRLLLQGFVDGRFIQKSLVNQYNEIEKWKSTGKILVVRYEDLIGEKGNGDFARQIEAVEQIACFLNVSTSRFKIANICEFLCDSKAIGFEVGNIGRWADVLTPEFLELFNSEMSITMKKWGYA